MGIEHEHDANGLRDAEGEVVELSGAPVHQKKTEIAYGKLLNTWI